jgi:chromate transport protein ChrA
VKKSPWLRAFLDGVNVASLRLMEAVSWELARSGVVDIFTVVLALSSLVLVFRFKVNSAWLLLGRAGWHISCSPESRFCRRLPCQCISPFCRRDICYRA